MKTYFSVLVIVLCGLAGITGCEKQSHSQNPNIIILFTDDMGYGDLSSYGSPTIRTPNIDSLADQGMRFTSFLTASWCVPSRTQLLTGQYMPRVKFGGGTGADGKGGLPDSLMTLAEGLNQAGYATGMAGKWHLGYSKDQYLPPNQGFDSWLGLPYSHDYMLPWFPTDEPMAMYRGTDMIEHPVNFDSLTVRYTNEATRFINKYSQENQPFFYYLAYNMPHLPIHTTSELHGKSGAGLYADVVGTIDWSVGQVLNTLEKQGLTDNTIIFFASDNGPWLNLPDRVLQAENRPWHQGTTGPLRGSKRTTYEGGARVPAIIRWPGHISEGQLSSQLAASPDIYKTMLEVGGATLPDYKIDGKNLMPWFSGEQQKSPRQEYAYFLNGELEAMVVDEWKLRLASDSTQLFNLQSDPAERFNRADENPDIVNKIRKKMQEMANEVDVPVAEPTSK